MASSSNQTVPELNIETDVGKSLWIKFRKERAEALCNPFLVSLAAGNLNLDTFRDFFAQDLHLLRAFALAYGTAEECADDDVRLAIREQQTSVLNEIIMHDKFGVEWDFDLNKIGETAAYDATVKYTDFVSATASGEIDGVKSLDTPFERTKLAAYTVAAIIPCFRLFAFIGREFKALVDPSEGIHLYKRWIDNCSDDLQAVVWETEGLLDKLCVALTGAELDIVEKVYRRGLKLVLEFFQAQPLVQRTVFPLCREHNPAEHCLVLFSDFDLTCTDVDSSAILAELAIVTAPKTDENQSGDQLVGMSSADSRTKWEELARQYTEEYEHCIDNILFSDKEEGLNKEGLLFALDCISEFEKKANLRVTDSEVLKGLYFDDVRRAGEHLILQDGCADFFLKAIQNENLNTNINILSDCWCGDLARSAFASAGLEAINIHTNELIFEDSLSTGEIVKKVESPGDKLEAFNNILQNCSKDEKILTVYIGDSVSDLLCLLEADIGIVIGSSPSLRRLGSHFGVSFVPLFQGLVAKQKLVAEDSTPCWRCGSVLYTVSSWREIHAFILGL